MTVKLSSLKVDLQREVDGEWIDSMAFPGVRWHLKSLNDPDYVAARSKVLRQFRSRYGGQTVPTDEASIAFGKLYATHILMEWEGLDVAYSPESATETLGHPEYREVVSDIEQCAAQVARIEVEYVEDTAKNSEQPSATQ